MIAPQNPKISSYPKRHLTIKINNYLNIIESLFDKFIIKSYNT